MLFAALQARKNSYCPYSHFAVGAALRTKTGKIYKGCNIENATFSDTTCGERAALANALADGSKDFDCIVITANTDTKSNGAICPPCGICRQVLLEFVDPDEFLCILAATDESGKVTDYKIYT